MTVDNRAPEASLTGVVERVVFQRAETGYTVVRLTVDKGAEATLVGMLPDVQRGEVVRATGAWQRDPAWGRQFVASAVEILPPSNTEALEHYLASGVVHGLGDALAKRLVQRFGMDLPSIIERDPEKLREVPGVGGKLVERMVESWREQRQGRDLLLFLHSHGVPLGRARAVLKTYGERAMTRIMAAPYALARDVEGIGFTTADTLARSLGLPDDAPGRRVAALEQVLRDATDSGHTVLPVARLVADAAALIGIDAGLLEESVEEAISHGHLVETVLDSGRWLQLPVMANAEAAIAEDLLRLAAEPLPWRTADIDAALERAERELGLELAGEQREAVAAALRRKILVLTGGPGTGKTTIVRAILAALEGRVRDVALAAPTGRAARRLADSTGREARTLHRLLEAQPGRAFARNADRQLECELLVVDEASMIDVSLCGALLEAIPSEAALLLVGDVDQLPSVGPGDVLGDLIRSGAVPVVRLTTIFRQAESSSIVLNAHRINRGELPLYPKAEDGSSDFYGIRAETPEDAADKLVDLVAERMPQRFGLDPLQDIQVLVPTNRGVLGTRELNRRLAARLNPERERTIERAGNAFAPGDKIMVIENDYEREIYNGDLGRLVAIDEERSAVKAQFDGRELSFAFNELDRLLPAFATTVHKAQGSEYPAVVVVLARQHGRMLKRRLLYTAVTRAKRLLVLLTDPVALDRAVRDTGEERRLTLLEHRLKTAFGDQREGQG